MHAALVQQQQQQQGLRSASSTRRRANNGALGVAARRLSQAPQAPQAQAHRRSSVSAHAAATADAFFSNGSSSPAADPPVRQSSPAQVAVPPARVPWYDKNCPANMKNISGIQELVDELADAGDKLVIVETFAPWCAACKALFPKICQIMEEHVDDVVFLKVSFDDNRDMCRNMGIKVLPYFHVYHGALGRVAQFSCTVSKVQRFRDVLDEHLGAICSLEEPEALVAEFPEVHPHHPLILEVHEDDMYDHPPAPVFTSPDRPTPVF